jgi:two-component sensor histidine kinase
VFREIVHRRTHSTATRALADVAIGLAAAIIAVAGRVLLVSATGPSALFALNFVAAVIATLLGGWRAGVVAVIGAQVLTWFVVIEPGLVRSPGPQEAATLALATAAQLFLVAVIARYQYDVDRARAEAHHEHELRGLLLFELKHRMKNTLTLVQSLAQQTFRNQSIDDVAEAYYRRLNALGRTHDLLTQCEWTGADIKQIIEQSTYAVVSNRDRLVIDGPSLVLDPKTCLSLTLVFHELATNSVKYGAWSNNCGLVTLAWSNDPSNGFLLQWHETGGPPVIPPSKHGFGTSLIERATASELSADVKMSYQETGFSCVVKAPYIASSESLGSVEPLPTLPKVIPQGATQPAAV